MNNQKIAVIDIETPNRNNDIICSIGIVLIENESIVDTLYYLVNPETTFDEMNINIHGITENDVVNAPIFPEVWDSIKDIFSGYLLAGHNFTFDLSCIKKALIKYNIEAVSVYYVDTLTISRNNIIDIENYQLSSLCDYFGTTLTNHHNALADSYATAEILLYLLKNYDIELDSYIRPYRLDGFDCKEKKSVRFSDTTKALQELQGFIMGITCDGILSDDEIYGMQQWVDTHCELKGQYPFDKIYGAVEQVLEDNIITEGERKYLFALFNNILNPVDCNARKCSIDVIEAKICLTGDFDSMSKSELEKTLELQGAIIKKTVVKDLKYLIVGGKGSDKWAHGNYGTKVKKAMEWNEKGANIEIIKEEDIVSLFIDC